MLVLMRANATALLLISFVFLLPFTPVHGKASTLGKLDEFLDEGAGAGQCLNGICTVHGPGGSSEYSEVFEQFVPEFFAGGQDMNKLMEAAKKAGESGDMAAMTKMATKHQQESQKRLSPFVAQIYEQFVSPTAGGVDPETGRAIVKEFLTACQRHMPLLARQSMETGVKFAASMAGGEGGAMMRQMEEGMKEYMPQVSKTMSAVIVELLRRSDDMADEIFEAMDGNKDGLVTRKEFEKDFVTAMQQIVNMQALAQTAQKVMEQISPADLEQLSSMIDPEMLKQLAQMDPQVLMQQLKQMGMGDELQKMMGGMGMGGMPGMGGPGGGRKGRANPLGKLM